MVERYDICFVAVDHYRGDIFVENRQVDESYVDRQNLEDSFIPLVRASSFSLIQ